MIENEDGVTPACLVRVKVVPGASRDEIVGPLGDRLKVRVSAPPEGGKANKAVCALLARAAGVRAAAVSVVAGHGSAEKTIRIEGRSAAELASSLPAARGGC